MSLPNISFAKMGAVVIRFLWHKSEFCGSYSGSMGSEGTGGVRWVACRSHTGKYDTGTRRHLVAGVRRKQLGCCNHSAADIQSTIVESIWSFETFET